MIIIIIKLHNGTSFSQIKKTLKQYVHIYVFAQYFHVVLCDLTEKNEWKKKYKCFTILCLINYLHLFKEVCVLWQKSLSHGLAKEPRYCTICTCVFIHMHINICLCNLPTCVFLVTLSVAYTHNIYLCPKIHIYEQRTFK